MRPTLLIVSPRDAWPEPLQARMDRCHLNVHRVRTCHEAAAAVAAKSATFVGILIDSEWLSVRELDMMNVIQRHTALPIWTLPASLHPKPGNDLGSLPWEAVALAFSQRLHIAPTPDVGTSSNKMIDSHKNDAKAADNQPPKTPEIPLAPQVAARYDGVESPVLSRSEIAALLGMDESPEA